MAKKTTTKKKTTKKKTTRKGSPPPSSKDKQLVIVESPSKAKTINKYLGPGYIVMASVGHIRDLPSKNPKGVKSPVPGVDLEADFKPTYEVLTGKNKALGDLKKAAKQASDIWFATDLDREGEAIAWHLAEELGVPPGEAKRVIFSAITKSEIDNAFNNPHPIDMDRVNAQQARRLVDRIVGYQVSPLLWKKVARGLSAGRVQSVAVRLVVDREREIRAFIPDEYWQMHANFTLSASRADGLAADWEALQAERDEKGNPPTQKRLNAWLGEQDAIRAELVEVGGEKFDVRTIGEGGTFENASDSDASPRIEQIASLAGLTSVSTEVVEDGEGVGPARWRRTIGGRIDPTVPYAISAIETKRTSSRPPAPFITSTLQQAASSRLSFNAKRTMRTAQALYEGVDVPGEGPVGLITYMRTDSTHLAKDAIAMARDYILQTFGNDYLPEKANVYSSSNKDAQEAHEAIRPASLAYPPSRVKSALKPDQYRLYCLIWERFVGCQMMPAKWDATTISITGGTDPKTPCTFRASGRVLVFDGFYKVAGVPLGGDTANLPPVEEKQPLSPFSLDVAQKFTSPPARYSEASLIKMLESEGIGRPSTYADIITKIQDRKYVETVGRSFYASDLGEVVTDKLVEAFPQIMDIGYTRGMEQELDKVEDENLDWVDMLHRFYSPFKDALEHALENLQHAKAEIRPAPKEYRCQKCESDLCYRFGKNGRFLSCTRYPDCDYACPVDRQGRPRPAEIVNVKCPKTGRPMIRKTGRFGPFLMTQLEEGETNDDGMILNLDKKGFVTAPSQPPIETELTCDKCEAPLNLRNGVRGPWLGCSRFPKCRGRGKWTAVEEKMRETLEKKLEQLDVDHPIPIITMLDGTPLTGANGKPLPEAPNIEQLVVEDPEEVLGKVKQLGSVA